ncbi:MAG: tetratricopeptide repeat protein [Acidobacteria bacterium]|nr:tetratricopeptide repeat protein [Acidobacteriota bacterium]
MTAMSKHLEKAERLLQKGKLEAALEEYLVALKEEPDNDAIVYTVAELYQRLSRAEECRQCYGYLLDKSIEKKDGTRSIELFRKLQKFGTVEPKRLLACVQFLENQKPEEAIQLYSQALETLGTQDPTTALECARRLVVLQPSSMETKWRLATLALKAGKKDIASSTYQQIGEQLLAEKRYNEAIEALEQSSRLSPNNFSAQLVLAQACCHAGRFQRVLELLGKLEDQSDQPEVLNLLAQAYQAEKQLGKAEALYWKLLESVPQSVEALTEIAAEYLRQQDTASGLQLLQRLEQYLSARKRQAELRTFAEKLRRLSNPDIAVLEFCARLFDQLHLDSPLSDTLNRLFDVHLAAGQVPKAAENLGRLIDVDPYSPDCSSKLRRLEGKVNREIWQDLTGRLGQASTGGQEFAMEAREPVTEEEPIPAAPQPAANGEEGGNTLRDLMLQAEIFLQYRLHDKARERLQRIAKLFPKEEDKNSEIRSLFQRAQFTPQYAATPNLSTPAGAAEISVDFSRVSEISRNLSRQGTVKGVLSTAANDIGRFWQVSRCVAGLATPNAPPSMALEYIAPGVSPSEPVHLARLVMGLQQVLGGQNTPLAAEAVGEASQLAELRPLLEKLQVQSLVAVPLRDSEQSIGILVLEQCGNRRAWKATNLGTLEALGEQVVLAVSNVRLRNLMKTLAVTDERSGLLHRDSYLTCLLSETERTQAQKTPLTGALLYLSLPQPGIGTSSGRSLEDSIQELSGTLISRLRQNDIAVKYGPQSLALILPGATSKDAATVVEKLRRLLVSASSGQAPPQMAVGFAEAVQDQSMDSADVVTELVNRLEWALEEARKAGPNDTKVLEPPVFRR